MALPAVEQKHAKFPPGTQAPAPSANPHVMTKQRTIGLTAVKK